MVAALQSGPESASLDFSYRPQPAEPRAMSASAKFNLTTFDGDKVSFSAEAMRMSGRGHDHRAEGSHKSDTPASRPSFDLSVQGELSKDELADIRKVLRNMKHMVKNFFQGNMDGAAAAAGRASDRLTGLDTVAGFDLALEFSKEQKAAEKQTRAAANEPAPARNLETRIETVPSNRPQQADRAEQRPTPTPPPSVAKKVSVEPKPVSSEAKPSTPAAPPAPPPAAESAAPAPTAVEAPAAGEQTGEDASSPMFEGLRSLFDSVLQGLRDAGFDTPRFENLIPHLLDTAINELKQDPALEGQEAELDQVGGELNALYKTALVPEEYADSSAPTPSRTAEFSLHISVVA